MSFRALTYKSNPFRQLAFNAWIKARRAAVAAYRSGKMTREAYFDKEDRLQRAWDERWFKTRDR